MDMDLTTRVPDLFILASTIIPLCSYDGRRRFAGMNDVHGWNELVDIHPSTVQLVDCAQCVRGYPLLHVRTLRERRLARTKITEIILYIHVYRSQYDRR